MAHCSDNIPGVQIVHVHEFEDWHTCPKAFNQYNIQFILPASLAINYQPNDKFFQLAYVGDIGGLQDVSDHEICSYRDKDGNNLLTLASHSDQFDMVCWLWEKGVSVKETSVTGTTPILAAAAKNHLRVVDFLISKGADVNEPNKYGFTPLLISAYNGHEHMIEKLIQAGGLVNWEDNHGRTPLMAACQRGHSRVVERLVLLGANVLQASSGPPAPFFAAASGSGNCLVPLGHNKTKNWDLIDHEGWSLLAVAAFHGNMGFVEQMFSSGANFDMKDKFGRTALMAAAEMGHHDIVHYLVENGASVNIQSNNGTSAFHLALLENYTDITRVIVKHLTCPSENKTLVMACRAGDLDVAQFLVKAGSSVNQQNDIGISPLIASCMSGNVVLTEYLLENGADVNLRTMNNMNAYQVAYLMKDYDSLGLLEPLFSDLGSLCCDIPVIASCLGKADVLHNLIQRGEDINAANSSGVTALMMTSYYGNKDIGSLLLENNAEVSAQNALGATALHYAIDANNLHMVDFLIGHGASVNRKYSDGRTLCHHLTTLKKLELLTRVVNFGGNINCQDQNGITPLMIACQEGSFDFVKYFVELNANRKKKCANDYDAMSYAFINNHTEIQSFLNDVSRNTPEDSREARFFMPLNLHRYETSEHDSPFFKACVAGELSLVKDICSAGQNIHARNNDDVNALHYASYHGHNDLAQWLLDNGALINCGTNDGVTPLMIAVHEGQEDTVEVLIKNKCLLNLRDDIYRSALKFAVVNNKISILKILLQHNPLVDLIDGEGNTPLNFACLNGFIDIVMILVENHANINRRDAYGRVPLMAAARNGHTDVVQFLLEKGADVSVVSDEGKTAAHYAQQTNHIETLNVLHETAVELGLSFIDNENLPQYTNSTDDQHEKFLDICESEKDLHQLAELLGNGVDIDCTNANGQTGLLLAVQGGHIEVVNELLSRNANIDIKDNYGTTALVQAVQTGSMALTVKLIEKGADLEVRDQFGNDITTIAAENNNKEMLRYLMAMRSQTDRYILQSHQIASGIFLDNVIQCDIENVSLALQNPGYVPIDQIKTAMNFAILTYDSDSLHTFITSSFHLLDDQTPPLILCIQEGNEVAFCVCLAHIDAAKVDFDSLVHTANRQGQAYILQRLINENRPLSRSGMKRSLIQNLDLAQYELMELLAYKLTQSGNEVFQGKTNLVYIH